MKYEKPEIVAVDNALEAVRGIQKGAPFVRDSKTPHLNTATVSAYEADE